MKSKIKKLFLKTYGCQMNVFDSERIEESLINFGIKKVCEEQNSDLIILNTCHIREKAAEKVYSELGRFRKLKRQRAIPSTTIRNDLWFERIEADRDRWAGQRVFFTTA